MKVQKKLLLLVGIMIISASCYGMNDEYQKVEFEALRLNDEATTNFYSSKMKKNIKSIARFTLSEQYNVNFLHPKNCKNLKFADDLGTAIANSRIDIVETGGGGKPYAYIWTWESLKAIDKSKSFWQRHPLSCLSLAFLAGGLTLKLYDTWFK